MKRRRRLARALDIEEVKLYSPECGSQNRRPRLVGPVADIIAPSSRGGWHRDGRGFIGSMPQPDYSIVMRRVLGCTHKTMIARWDIQVLCDYVLAFPDDTSMFFRAFLKHYSILGQGNAQYVLRISGPVRFE